jgi:hypothetical protein
MYAKMKEKRKEILLFFDFLPQNKIVANCRQKQMFEISKSRLTFEPVLFRFI